MVRTGAFKWEIHAQFVAFATEKNAHEPTTTKKKNPITNGPSLGPSRAFCKRKRIHCTAVDFTEAESRIQTITVVEKYKQIWLALVHRPGQTTLAPEGFAETT